MAEQRGHAERYRALSKIGTRKRQWLIVNEHGGLKEEFTGTEAQAKRRAEALSAEEVKHT